MVRSLNISLLSRRADHYQFIRFEWWRVLLNDSRQRISIKQAGYQWNSLSNCQFSSWVHQDPLWICKDHPVLQRNLIWSISKNHRSSQNFQLTNIRTHSWLRSFQQQNSWERHQLLTSESHNSMYFIYACRSSFHQALDASSFITRQARSNIIRDRSCC